ncbi:ABC transporter permease subunit [Paenibacillus sp. TRM 82003]|nr:ABC transporter permease subunit [Paenibacillus sp. TRM 82003]
MIVPVVLYFVTFAYYPLVRGFTISFQKFRVIGDRPFVGLENYETVLADPNFWRVLGNTAFIGGGVLLLNFLVPLLVALSLNEIRFPWFKKTTQMIIYLPHLFSWVVVAGIWIFMLSPDGGLVNLILGWLDAGPIHFLAETAYGRWVMVLSNVWKEAGFLCIIYLAAIVAIDPTLYEAARIDGANRWERLKFVTLPQLGSTMKVVLLLNTVGALRIFDQVYIMKNPAIERSVDVAMIYMFEKGIMKFDMGVANAAGFLLILATLALTLVVRRATRFDEG